MMDLELDHGQAEPEQDEPEDGSLGVNVSVSEVDGTWHSATTCIPVDLLTPEAIAEVMISCLIGVAATRSPSTLIALQQRLMDWGR